jgi:NDP-sugar pyrophosphorylase family protein/aminoglycoside/choline kinase family phosphotransferase
MRAFILAAGYGERLRPITDHIPKPLLPLLGKPTIEVVLERIASLPVESFGINTHHKAEMLRNWANTTQYAGKIQLFHEKSILGTGGALRNASNFLGRSAFIVHNADILSDIDLPRIVEEHLSSGNMATLAVHNHDKFNNIWIDNAGILRKVGKVLAEDISGLCKIAFTGIAVYSPDFLSFLPDGSSSIVDAWLKALNAGHKVGTVDCTGCSWTDIGSPAAYASAVFEKLDNSGETVYVHATAECSKAIIEGFAAIESGCVIGSGARLANCILLPGTRISDGVIFKDAIACENSVVRLQKKMGSAPAHFSEAILAKYFRKSSKDLASMLIGTGGSDRKYYRLQTQDKSAVLMVCSEDDPDYARHITYTAFFRKHALPVPVLFTADEAKKQALFEDLGNISLYSWLQCRRSVKAIEDIYLQVINLLAKLHTEVSRKATECALLASRVFDYEHFRWETGYFLERFVSGLMGITVHDRTIDEEFNRLAEEVDAFPKVIVHRDFQSQNIMITKTDQPRIIDYQGARMGPPAYDLASVLWDPYYRLDDALRERLVTRYIRALKADAPDRTDDGAFRYSLLLCRLQRHMQALGAYGFLAKIKGKKYFLKHIPPAMRYLIEEVGLVREQYPSLHELVKKLSAVSDRESSGRVRI